MSNCFRRQDFSRCISSLCFHIYYFGFFFLQWEKLFSFIQEITYNMEIISILKYGIQKWENEAINKRDFLTMRLIT